jgi:hypothetical protein
MRRRAAIEPVIGHLKEDHRVGRNYLTGRDCDRINSPLPLQLQPAPALVRGAFTRPLVDPLPASPLLGHALGVKPK